MDIFRHCSSLFYKETIPLRSSNSMKEKTFLLALLLCLTWTMQAAIVDTLAVYSASMNKKISVIVITPERVKSDLPVTYLLHGYSGNEKSWINIRPDLPAIAEQYGMMIVCPDGENSWYWDSPKNASMRYETFIAQELVSYIDNHYATRKSKKGRAITGLSMGGHGAMWLAFRHKELFGAVGSTSGGLDIRPFPNNWEMAKQLGKKCDNREVWEAHTVINQIDRLQNGDLAIIFDCGYSDFFYEVNEKFHRKLLEYKIDHDFLVRPGAHNNAYWRNSIMYQLLFFHNFFTGKPC